MPRLSRNRGSRRSAPVESADRRAQRELNEIEGVNPVGDGPDEARGGVGLGPRVVKRLREGPNVGGRERAASALLGGALLAEGLRRRSPLGALLAIGGGALVARGASGRCPAYAAMGRDTTDRARREGRMPQKQYGPNAVLDASESIRVEHSIVVDRPVEQLYDYWRNLENLPLIMRHIVEVRDIGGGNSTWVARGPAGTRVRWRARIINEIPNELLAWKSLAGADIPNAGSVRFAPGPDGTSVRVVLEFDPPGGRLGARIAGIFGEDPGSQVLADLVNFRRAMEAELPLRLQERELGLPTAAEPEVVAGEGGDASSDAGMAGGAAAGDGDEGKRKP